MAEQPPSVMYPGACNQLSPTQPPGLHFALTCARAAGHDGYHSCYPDPARVNHTAYSLWGDPADSAPEPCRHGSLDYQDCYWCHRGVEPPDSAPS